MSIDLRKCAAVWGVLALALDLCPAQTSTGPAATAPQREQLTPSYTRVARVPAEMLDNRPRVFILPCEPQEVGEEQSRQSAGAIGSVPSETHLLPEGYIVASRRAQIVQDGKWYLAHLEEAADLPSAAPLRLLPNRRLSMIEAILAQADRRPTFQVTGRVTEFQGVNYLLLETVAEESAGPAQGLTVKSKPVGSTTQAPKETATTRPAHEPSAEEIVAEMMKMKPLRSVVMPESVSATTAPAAEPRDQQMFPPALAAAREGPRWPEGTLLVDRSGRVVPAESGWMFAFEDQGLSPKEAPVRLLPNRLLETALAVSAGGAKGVVLIISGEVTAHQGGNHLLLRKVLVRRNLGNFR